MLKAALVTIFTGPCCCEIPTNPHLTALWITGDKHESIITKLRVGETVELHYNQCTTCSASSVHFSYHDNSNTTDKTAPVLIAYKPCKQN